MAVSIAVTGALVVVIAGRWDEFVAAITAAPAELPVPQRKAIERAYFGGLSHIQIGRALRVPSAA